MKTIHPAIAEHVMEENEKLREVLRCIADLPMDRCSTENDYRLSAAKAIALGALSQQAEPTDTFTAVDMATAAAQGFRDGQAAVEPAPAQDELAIDTAPLLHFIFSEYSSPEMAGRLPDDVVRVVRALEAGARPAQTEQHLVAGSWQSVAWKALDRILHASEWVRDAVHYQEVAQGLANAALVAYRNAAPIAQTAPQPEQSGLAPEGYALVPITPTEEQWSGLARDLMMWLDMSDKTAQGLFKHLRMIGVEPPQWLRDEPEMQGAGVPSKGTRVTLIYRAMIEDFLASLSAQGGE
ncbi:hypothetical protein G7Z98_09255 [Pseudomonas stutzeri]|nr:hypothetical protein [Stutzerimonas stutzeri]